MGIEAKELKESNGCIWSEGNLKLQKRMDSTSVYYVAEVLVALNQVGGEEC